MNTMTSRHKVSILLILCSLSFLPHVYANNIKVSLSRPAGLTPKDSKLAQKKAPTVDTFTASKSTITSMSSIETYPEIAKFEKELRAYVASQYTNSTEFEFVLSGLSSAERLNSTKIWDAIKKRLSSSKPAFEFTAKKKGKMRTF